MGINGIFNQTVSLLERSLDLRAMKHKSIVSNVANIDTPHYKAFDVMVEDELQRLNRTSGAGADIQAATPREGHLHPREPSAARISRHIGPESDIHIKRQDGNTVDLDREMATMAENSLMYTLSAQIVAKKFQSLRNVIEGGKK
jgi:flagellar basal-body rod protein FlgB